MYSRFDRLTFDGQGNAAVAVDQSLVDDQVISTPATSTQTTCSRMPASGFAAAISATPAAPRPHMLRDQFVNNTVAGVLMRNFNALDMFIWYSFSRTMLRGDHIRAGHRRRQFSRLQQHL